MPWPTGMVCLVNGAALTDANLSTPSSFADQSGAGNNLSVSAGTATVKTNRWNGNRTITLNAAGLLSLTTTLSQRSMTVLMVYRHTHPNSTIGGVGNFRGQWKPKTGTIKSLTWLQSTPSLLMYDTSGGGSGVSNVSGYPVAEMGAIMWRGDTANDTITTISGDGNTLDAPPSGTTTGLDFGMVGYGGSGELEIGLIAVWNSRLSNGDRDAAMAMAYASYPKAETMFAAGSATRICVSGTSIMSGYGTTAEANTIGGILAATYPNTLNRALASSTTTIWNAVGATRCDGIFTGGTGLNFLINDYPTNDGDETAWGDFFAARKAATPGLITLGATRIPRNPTTYPALNAALLAHYDAWPSGGALAYKIKPADPQLGRFPDYLYDAASNATITGNYADTVHPDDTGTAAFAAGYKAIIDALVNVNTNTDEDLYDMELVDDELPYTPSDSGYVTSQIPIDDQSGFYVESDGAVKVVNARGRTVTYSMKAGQVRRLRILQILDTGTDATTVYIRAYPVKK